MIALTTVWAVMLRHVRMVRRDFNYILMCLYWPLLDIVVWGFLGAWIQKAAQFDNYEAAALLGILLWQVVGRSCNIMGLSLTEEMYSHNIVNMFSLPIRLVEWIGGVILYSAVMMLITALVSLVAIIMLYDVSLWEIVSTYALFVVPLFFSGIWLGFTGLQIVILLGKRGTELGFVIGWFLMPFSGAYYPLEVLPAWGKTIGSFLPMSYLFQGMRGYVMHKQDPTPYLITGSILSIVYALIAIIVFVYCFNYSRRKGLARLTD